MNDRELMQQALEALTRIWEDGLENYPVWAHEAAIDNLRERLAQPEQEPATKAGELRAMKDEFWKQPEQEPVVWALPKMHPVMELRLGRRFRVR